MLIFNEFGIEISFKNEKYYLTFDEGEIAVKMVTIEISEEDAKRAQRSSNDAYQVILKYQNMKK